MSLSGPRFRAARPEDAVAGAALHADSWRRHYRGALADAFLDNEVGEYLGRLWTERLAAPPPNARTVLPPSSGLHLTVLDQNSAAQAFYAACGGTAVERLDVPAPGGDPARLSGKPICIRFVWRAGELGALSER